MSKNNYYVYAYLREDGTPYYIGKGKNNRAYQKHKFAPLPKNDDSIILLHTNLEEQKALDIERELVLKYGREDIGTGILLNRTNGGDRGILEPGKIRWINDGSKDLRISIKEEVPEGWSEGRLFRHEKKKYINNGNRNTRISIDDPVPEGWFVGRLGSNNKNYIYINDGIKDKFIPKDQEIPHGWTKGRAYRNNSERMKLISEGNKNWRWINNGQESLRIRKDQEIPEGWTKGSYFVPGSYKPRSTDSYMKAVETRRKNGTLKPTKEQISKMVETRKKNGTYRVSEETRKKISESNRKKSNLSGTGLEKFF